MSTQPVLQLSDKYDDAVSVEELGFSTACRLLDDYIDFIIEKIQKFKNIDGSKTNWYTISRIQKGNSSLFSLLLPFSRYVADMQLLTNKSHVLYERGDLNVWEKMELGLKLDRAEETLQVARAILKEYESYMTEVSKSSAQK
ncbi:hypothetical protein [Armatimonas sp.]|uniref:hypothetical protein n=1 Tax=Armatimonas sp. TaxID=1872638 RepID=UPI00374FEA85